VIVSQSLALRFWPNQDPIGRRIKAGFSHDTWCTVVGVVGNVRQFDLQDESGLAMYIPYDQSPTPFLMQTLTLVVRSRSDEPFPNASAARGAIAGVDPDLPLFDVASVEQLVCPSLSFRQTVRPKSILWWHCTTSKSWPFLSHTISNASAKLVVAKPDHAAEGLGTLLPA
jgi:hypothetical protein